MKNLKSFILLAFISLSLISCDNDDDNTGPNSNNSFLKVGNKEYTLKAGTFENYGEILDGVTNIDIILATTQITSADGEYYPVDEVFSTIYFELYTSDANNLTTGMYNFNLSEAANTFDYGVVQLETTLNDEEESNYHEITSGSFEVLENGSTYHFKFEGQMDNGQEFSGSYKGNLLKSDYSKVGKEAAKTKTSAFITK